MSDIADRMTAGDGVLTVGKETGEIRAQIGEDDRGHG